MQTSRLSAAFVLALSMHVATLAALASWRKDAPNPPGGQEITIDLAPSVLGEVSAAAAEVAQASQAAAESTPVPPPPEPESVSAEMEMKADIPEIQEPEPIREEAKVELPPSAEETTEPMLPEMVKSTVEQEPKLPPKEVKKIRSKPSRKVPTRASPPSDARNGVQAASRENMSASAASGDPSVRSRFNAQIMAALRARMRYPSSAQTQGHSGVATVLFTMARSGEILRASIVQSAGQAMLDEAALAATRPGSFLRAAPEGLPDRQFTFRAPLRFDLR